MPARFLVLSCLASGAAALAPPSVESQTVSGVVQEQVSHTPVPHAVLTLFELGAGGLSPVSTGTSDESGRFHLLAPGPGRFQVQADHDGLSSPLSEAVTLDEGRDVPGIALLVPSRLLMMAYECQDDEAGTGSAVVGILRDRDSGIPLPEATVTARWEEEDGANPPGFVSGASDGAGRYRLCGVPAGPVSLRARLLGREGEADGLEVPDAAVVFHDMEIALGSITSGDRGVIQERTLIETAARGLGDLTGLIVDRGAGTPVSQAVVRIRDTGFQGVTDRDGRFAFEGLQPGVYLLEIQHLGYSVQTSEVEVPPERDVRLRLRITPEAIEIAGIDVRARSEVERTARLSTSRRDVVYGSAMATEERSAATVPDILRRSVPGLQVTELYRPDLPPLLCISTSRRIQGLQPRHLPDCNETNPQLVLDGIRIDDLEVLRTLPASEIESIEFLTPLQAQVTHGIGGRTSNGVIEVYTRGKGPYVTELRNVP